MKIIDGFGETPPFEIQSAEGPPVPIVFNSPHSGRHYPRAFVERARLDRLALRRSEDAFVDELFADVTALGAPLLKANFPRAYLDVNREPYELDPLVFEGDLPAFARTTTARVAAGLGTIARVVADSQPIYRERLPVAEGLSRIDTLYRPYHAALGALLEGTRARFGFAVLVDCHSMPSAARGLDAADRPDIIVGDRFGTSCDRSVTAATSEIFGALGYRVGCNRPYAGGFITERYGRPSDGVHVVQVEINRALYMDEARCVKAAGFERVRRDMLSFAADLVEALFPEARQGAEAAE